SSPRKQASIVTCSRSVRTLSCCSATTGIPDECPFRCDHVDGPPGVLVSLAAAQEMKFLRAIPQGILDGLAQENGAGAVIGKARVEPAEVGIGATAVQEPI